MSEALFYKLPTRVQRALFPSPIPSTYGYGMLGLRWTKHVDKGMKLTIADITEKGLCTSCVYTSTKSNSYIMSIPYYIAYPTSNDAYLNMIKLREKYKTLLIYIHGNAMDLGKCTRFLDAYSRILNVPIIAFDYPGYGLLSHLNATKESIDAALIEILLLTRNKFDWPTDQTVLFGQSIGTGPCCQIASNFDFKLGGIILLSPYTTISDVVYDLVYSQVGFLGSLARLFVPVFWNNLENIAKIDINLPVLIIHGKQDNLILPAHTKSLQSACSSQNLVVVLPEDATHNNFNDIHDIIEPITAFLSFSLAKETKALD